MRLIVQNGLKARHVADLLFVEPPSRFEDKSLGIRKIRPQTGVRFLKMYRFQVSSCLRVLHGVVLARST